MRTTLLALALILTAGLFGFSRPANASSAAHVYVDLGDVYFEYEKPYYRPTGEVLSVAYYYGKPRYYRPSHSYRGDYRPGYGYGKSHGYKSGYGYGKSHGYKSDYGYGKSHGYRGDYRHGYGHGYRSGGYKKGYGHGRGGDSSGYRSHGRGHR